MQFFVLENLIPQAASFLRNFLEEAFRTTTPFSRPTDQAFAGYLALSLSTGTVRCLPVPTPKRSAELRSKAAYTACDFSDSR